MLLKIVKFKILIFFQVSLLFLSCISSNIKITAKPKKSFGFNLFTENVHSAGRYYPLVATVSIASSRPFKYYFQSQLALGFICPF